MIIYNNTPTLKGWGLYISIIIYAYYYNNINNIINTYKSKYIRYIDMI